MIKRLFLLALLCCFLSNARAGGKTGILYMTTPAYYEVKNLSRNGLWACGVKYDPDKEANFGFRWNLQTNYIEMLGGQCQANCVSDDGTVVGSFYTSEGISSGKSIEVPALWKDGNWTVLELPDEKGSWASGITPDGTKIVGANNDYVAYVWTNGQISARIVPTGVGNVNMPYVISPDGSMIGGWAYAHDRNYRNAGYWTVADGQFHDLEPNREGDPWQAVKRFTKDNGKLLFWGGYHEDKEGHYGMHAIYNIATQDTTLIYPIEDDPFNFDFYDMNADGTVVTGYEENENFEQYGIIWDNGSTELVYDYLTDRGADFDDFDIMAGDMQPLSLIGVPGVDDDARTFALFYYDKSYNYHSMIVAFDRDMSMTPPVNLKVVQVAGLPTVELSWEAPLGDKSTLNGFNIYRNGERIATVDATDYSYYDKNLTGSVFNYKVTALYDEGETKTGTESTVTLAEDKIQSPTSLLARQKGYNSLLAQWDAPESNLPSLCYYGDATSTLYGFGGGSVSFESGTLFPAERLSLYDGYSVAGVTFIPGTEQESWRVTLYTYENNRLRELYSQVVDQELKYGEKNTVYFTQPWQLQSGQDLIVGIETTVDNPSYNVQGVYEDCTKAGYTDLVRIVDEDDFYSLNEEGDVDLAWATGLLMKSPSAAADIDVVDHYTFYLNGAEEVQTKDSRYIASSMAAGTYNVGIEAVYADGRKSEQTASVVVLDTSDNRLPSITPAVSCSAADNIVKASWDAPRDEDATTLQYCGNTVASMCPTTNEDVTEFIARVDFLPTELKSYDGYQIRSFSFYPLSAAQFYMEVYDDEENLLAEVEVPECTLGQWNTVQLPEYVSIDPYRTYSCHLYASECPVDEAPLGIDNEGTQDNAAYLSVDGGTNWSNIEDESYLSGNWLLKLNIADADAAPLGVSQYDVYLDNKNIGSTAELTFSKDVPTLAAGETHTLRVDAGYEVSGTTVKGTPVDFQVSGSAGIEEISNSDRLRGESEGEQTQQLSNSETYNLMGQRLNKAAKGIVVGKGWKVVR